MDLNLDNGYFLAGNLDVRKWGQVGSDRKGRDNFKSTSLIDPRNGSRSVGGERE